MTTRHVLDQLPLWVGGDLDPADAESVQTHLNQCPSCCTAAEGLLTSQHWLRDAMASPFDAADGDHLRRAVMNQIRTETLPRFHGHRSWRPALLAASAAALILATLTWHREVPETRPLPSAGIQPTQPKPETDVAPPPLLARQTSVRAAPVPRNDGGSTSPAPPSRIELQTSDPTVRIIWLAQAAPNPEPTRLLQEEP